MKVLVTGAKGFVGQNLCATLENIRDKKDCRSQLDPLLPLEVFKYDYESTREELDEWCSQCDFVFHLAGVNRPKEGEEYLAGNSEPLLLLLEALERHGNNCPVMLSSSIQASLRGRFAGSEYGEAKLACERSVRQYSARTGAKVLIYRFPNLYGKWCRPNYNSAVATFCNNIARDLPVVVHDPTTELELLYIDDLVEEMLLALLGEENYSEDGFCLATPTNRVTLGEIVDLLYSFKESRSTLTVPNLAADSFSKKLYSTFLSYLEPNDFAYTLRCNEDERGSFVEFLRTEERGQVSVNVAKPGVTKGEHWHHSKWEKFLVVSGEALIRLRRVGCDGDGNQYPIIEYRVNGKTPTVVEMIPGYTHSICNLSSENDLVTVMWANEAFDQKRPDTYREEV